METVNKNDKMSSEACSSTFVMFKKA